MASNRPYYLYRMLRSLLNADGVNSSMTVFIDGFYDEPLKVSRLFNLRAVQQRPLGQRSARISHHYKSSLTAAFEIFPQAEYAIVFEEDLDVSRDALIYFNQTLELLKQDPSLYCISAWNDQGYEHTARDNSLLYRIETMPGLGWMLSRQLYEQELEPNWPSADKPHDWDMWIRTESVRKERECIIPDISRTFHFGSTGTNINSYFQKQYFSKHAFNLSFQDKFVNLDKMNKDGYEELMETLVRDANVIGYPEISDNSLNQGKNSTNYLCSLAKTDHHMLASSLSLKQQQNLQHLEFHTKPVKQQQTKKYKKSTLSKNANIEREERTNVIYIEMIDKHDFGNWLKLAKCWNIWDLDARGQHKSTWRLYLGGKATLVVGFPASPYSKFKPPNFVPFKL